MAKKKAATSEPLIRFAMPLTSNSRITSRKNKEHYRQTKRATKRQELQQPAEAQRVPSAEDPQPAEAQNAPPVEVPQPVPEAQHTTSEDQAHVGVQYFMSSLSS